MVSRIREIAGLLLGLALFLTASPALSASLDRETVHVRIKVLQIATVDLPSGPDFTLRVPNIPHCAPRRDRDWGWLKLISYLFRGSGGRNEWDNWRDDDWNRWADNDWWDDWDQWNGSDWQHHNWYQRCKSWLNDWYWPVIKPVRIPFTVTGNAIAEVSVKPHQFLRIKTGKYLGKATGPSNRTIGYDTIVHFPAPKWNYYWLSGWDFYDDWHDWRRWAGFGSLPSWSRWAKLPGSNNAGTPFLRANMVQRGGTAHGVVYIVSRRDFTTDGKKAKPGDYRGTIVLTVVADNI